MTEANAAGLVSAARVPTKNGGRYVEQLCRHWEHKLEVQRTERDASITLPSGSLVTLSADEDALDITVTAADAERLAEAQEVVRVHLDRFAFREAPLPFDWSAASG